MEYEWTAALSKTFTRLGQRMGDHLPNVLAAAALLLAGWILARLLRAWIVRLLGRLHWLGQSPAIRAGLRRIGVERPVAELMGALAFWAVLLFFLTAATEALALPVLATWLLGLSQYLPRFLVAVLIIFVGLLGGGLARDAVTAAGAAAGVLYAHLLGRVAQGVALLIAIVTAVDQLGINSTFLTATTTITIGAIVGGAALAFGLGARTAASNIIASHYLRQAYRVGNTVRIGPVQGTILEITTTGVWLESPEGRVLVPAKEFSEVASILVAPGV